MQKMMLRSVVVVTLISACLAVNGPASAQSSATGATVTKAEFVAKISDYFAWPHPSEYNDYWKVAHKQFKDVATADRYGKQIETAYEEGIIGADALGNFNPNNTISRQDAAVILARAFMIPDSGRAVMFSDNATIRPDARTSVNTLADLGYMPGKTPFLFMPNDAITTAEVDSIFDRITSAMVAPVQALPKQNAIAPRRYIKLYSPTPGVTIHFTTDGSTPSTSSDVYSVATRGHINEALSSDQLPERDVVYKAIAVKQGMASSPVQTFTWHLYRPRTDNFQHRLILAKTATRPAVYQVYNNSESVRAMAWYIEGQDKGILFDALQTNAATLNLKEYLDANIAQKPYAVIIGHEHGDHNAQAPNFLKAGVDVYMNQRGWAAAAVSRGPFRAVFPDADEQARVRNVDEGDVFQLGGSDLHVYALPGHAHGNIVIQDKANGLIFSSDVYGCTRAGSADNVSIAGVRTDLMLSLVQQTYANYRKGDGRIEMLFTGHDEAPLQDINLLLYEAALQQVVDHGEAACLPTLRGNNNRPFSRTTLIGDMWKDGTQWISLLLPGTLGDDTEYLTSAPVNYNGKDGFMQYSVLSNVELEGGELAGTTLQWGPAPEPYAWAGGTVSVTHSLPNKFDPWNYDYVIKVAATTAAITLIPTTMSTRVRSITLNGNEVGYRSRNTIAVTDGSVITLRIVAPDDKTTSSYTFTVDQ
ncbi:MAG: MBL fold metallo-hydrolase [Gammaproteobacteria bacterium]|nr:MBL fold metallo-hydrolase [Gammaproteobacteria bacterium]